MLRRPSVASARSTPPARRPPVLREGGPAGARARRRPSRRAVVALLALSAAAHAGTIEVGPGDSIQAAIDLAQPGDVIRVASGTFAEDLDFGGKALHVVGAGRWTVLQGTGTGPVVTFDDGEGPDSVLEGFCITGGVAVRGGGVAIEDSAPTILRNLVVGNRASVAGSGISVQGGSPARLFANLVAYNEGEGGSLPGAVAVVNASPVLVNNTIVRNSADGVAISGVSAPVLLNNVLVQNGSGKGADKHGAGVSEANGEDAVLLHNLFHRNAVGALVRGETKSGDPKVWKTATSFDKQNAALPGVGGNLDGPPGFLRDPPATWDETGRLDLRLEHPLLKKKPGRGVWAGHPDPSAENLDGTPNTLGWTGGPFGLGSTAVPGDDALGVVLP